MERKPEGGGGLSVLSNGTNRWKEVAVGQRGGGPGGSERSFALSSHHHDLGVQYFRLMGWVVAIDAAAARCGTAR